ncbi:hypothetical protein IEO21_10186 [Rhodonia placenta]|uniref:Uncharacterized protein n=1 Tax=Rhodonia placenta TaxID=104341 RepID=A0A8H7NSX5_9APHY|nr:hypothetical protein IEO21_10186 [Postia placenta]
MSFGIANRSNQISFLPAPNHPDARPGTCFGPLRSVFWSLTAGQSCHE